MSDDSPVAVLFDPNGNSLSIDSQGNAHFKLKSNTATNTSVAVSILNVTLLIANDNRLGSMIYNSSVAILYLKLGTTASLASYTVQIAPQGYYEVPYGYTGNIDAIWGSVDLTGTAQCTELT